MAAPAGGGRRRRRARGATDRLVGLHGNRSGGNLGPLPLGAMRLHRGAAAGVTVKLVPAGAKLEVRVAGPTVTPGYLGNADATARAFDEDGYYRTGDAVRLVREDDPAEGLMFDGRLAEDFKLDTGTWVSVAHLRSTLVSHSGACSPTRSSPAMTAHTSVRWPGSTALKRSGCAARTTSRSTIPG